MSKEIGILEDEKKNEIDIDDLNDEILLDEDI